MKKLFLVGVMMWCVSACGMLDRIKNSPGKKKDMQDHKHQSDGNKSGSAVRQTDSLGKLKDVKEAYKEERERQKQSVEQQQPK